MLGLKDLTYLKKINFGVYFLYIAQNMRKIKFKKLY